MDGPFEAATRTTPSRSNVSTRGRNVHSCRSQTQAPTRSTGCTRVQPKHPATGHARPTARMARPCFARMLPKTRTSGLVQARAISGACSSRVGTSTCRAAAPTCRRPVDGSCGVAGVAGRSRRRPRPVHVGWRNWRKGQRARVVARASVGPTSTHHSAFCASATRAVYSARRHLHHHRPLQHRRRCQGCPRRRRRRHCRLPPPRTCRCGRRDWRSGSRSSNRWCTAQRAR